MKHVFYFNPYPDTRYAASEYIIGYGSAYIDKGWNFQEFNNVEKLEENIKKYKSDKLIIQIPINTHSANKLNVEKLLNIKKRVENGKIIVNIPNIRNPIENRINESKSLKNDYRLLNIINTKGLVDLIYNSTEQNNYLMENYQQYLSPKYITLPLAANLNILNTWNQIQTDIKYTLSYIGTNLQGKRIFYEKNIKPLIKKYNIKIDGQDWKKTEEYLSILQKIGQYYNLPIIKKILQKKYSLYDELVIYKSSKFCLNWHEDYQREYGSDLNDRFFKIGLIGKLQFCDKNSAIKNYFNDDEIITFENKNELEDKIFYYSKNEDERNLKVNKVVNTIKKNHTYHNRVDRIINELKI